MTSHSNDEWHHAAIDKEPVRIAEEVTWRESMRCRLRHLERDIARLRQELDEHMVTAALRNLRKGDVWACVGVECVSPEMCRAAKGCMVQRAQEIDYSKTPLPDTPFLFKMLCPHCDGRLSITVHQQ